MPSTSILLLDSSPGTAPGDSEIAAGGAVPVPAAGASVAEAVLRQLDRFAARIAQALSRLQIAHDAAADAAARSQIVGDLEALFDFDLALATQKVMIRKRLIRGETAGFDLQPVQRLEAEIEPRLAAIALRGIEIDVNGTEPIARPEPVVPGTNGTAVPASPASGTQTVGPQKGAEILEIAKRHVGQRYENIIIDYSDSNWRGSFDCAEYASYCAWRAYGTLYGARLLSGTRPQGKNVEAYTGYWQEDANTKGIVVSEAEALRTPGAFILRYPPAPGQMGHIGICLGDGEAIYEAHSANRGIIKGKATDRRWNVGVLLPGVDYGSGPMASNRLLVYRELIPPAPKDEVVVLIQKALAAFGLLAVKDATGIFDRLTTHAVGTFQRQRGLVVDGEVGPETGAALGLGRFWGRSDSQRPGPLAQSTSPISTPETGIVSGQFNAKYNVTFGTHVQSGFYSHDPDDMRVRRSIRTNNPGALNVSNWQTEFRGFVGRTQPDSRGNVTTIYRTPEHGVAAWYHLIGERYGIAQNGKFTIGELAAKYSGTGSMNSAFALQYMSRWSHFAENTYDASSIVAIADDQSLLKLARAMFANEIGFVSPLTNAQILYGVNAWRTRSLT